MNLRRLSWKFDYCRYAKPNSLRLVWVGQPKLRYPLATPSNTTVEFSLVKFGNFPRSKAKAKFKLPSTFIEVDKKPILGDEKSVRQKYA